jgi:hypothetical protein
MFSCTEEARVEGVESASGVEKLDAREPRFTRTRTLFAQNSAGMHRGFEERC